MILPRLLMCLAAVGWGLQAAAADPPARIAPLFRPPPEYADDFGSYRSPLKFDDGTPVRTPADWARRRTEIQTYWRRELGEWPPLLDQPRAELGPAEPQDGYTRYRLTLQTAPRRTVADAYLLIPAGRGPFPAVVVVYYEAATAVGLGQAEHRDFARLLAKRGFVTLSLGGDPNTYYPTPDTCRIQPLAFHAYEAANCYQYLARRPDVDPARVGIVGHSYGGKWALFAGCLFEQFACMATSDPGIVFDEQRPNVNYWEPWYLGFDPSLPRQRPRGVPTASNPRTGPYRRLVADGRDLHELLALMAPRPLFVSGGSEDGPERWKALNHVVAVNRLLGYENRVALSTRAGHSPTPESNEQLVAFFEWALKPAR